MEILDKFIICNTDGVNVGVTVNERKQGTHYNYEYLTIRNYLNGHLHGISKKIHPDRWLWYETNYAGGWQHGVYRLYNIDGTVRTEILFVNGVDCGKLLHSKDSSCYSKAASYNL